MSPLPHPKEPTAPDTFASLIRDTRLFIQGQMRPMATSERASVPALPPQAKQQSPPPANEPEVTFEPVIPAITKPKIQPQAPSSPKNSDWHLQALPPAALPEPIRKKLEGYTPTAQPAVGACLILPEENDLHRLLLENVARAVTRTFTSATVVLYQEGMLKHPPGRLVLAPLALLQKKFSQAIQPHAPFKEGNCTWIALENLDLYNHDINAKRSLWMSIQRSFQS